MKKRDPMPTAMIYKVIDEMAPHVDSILPFLYQEPMMEPRLLSILQRVKCRNPNCSTAIYTNAALLTKDRSNIIIQSGWLDQIFISFYGPTEELYNKYQQGLNWARTKQNIRDLMQNREGHTKPYVTMWYIELPDLMAEIDKMKPLADLVDRFGVVAYETFCGLNPELVSYPGTVRKPCARLYQGMNILCDGTVVPCCLDYSGSVPLGNAVEENCLDIWNGDKMLKLRQLHLTEQWDQLPDLCRTCTVWKRV
jgi:hypothetical protein